MPHIPRIDELMISEIDGTLDPDERTELQGHLATCAECREELRLALAGREAAGRIPEVDAPPETLQPVIRALDRAAAGEVDEETADGTETSWAAGPRAERPRTPRGAWRVLVAAAAASLVVLGAIVVIPRGGDDASTSTDLEEVSGGARDQAAESAPAPTRPPGVERSSQDFDQPSLAALAAETTEDPRPSGAAPSQERLQEFAPAIDCVERWAEATQGGVALRVIEATFEGKPAYIGVFRVDTPPAKVVAWAVRQKDCRVLAVTTDRL